MKGRLKKKNTTTNDGVRAPPLPRYFEDGRDFEYFSNGYHIDNMNVVETIPVE